MVSTFTTARNLEKPAAGDQVGTWGTASINPDLDVIDAGMGQTVAVSGAAGNVVLSAAQFRVAAITFNSTLVGSISITFPTSFTGPYTIYNACSGSSAFIITMGTTATGGQVICAPPGELVDVFNDGANLRYRNLGRVGAFWDYTGSSVPNWVSGCTVPPYLNADGTTFSSATYPFLAVVLGGNTLPDSRGRVRAVLNQGTGRLTSSAGPDGNTNLASGGTATVLSSIHVPPATVSITDPGHLHLLIAAVTLSGFPTLNSTNQVIQGAGAGGQGQYGLSGDNTAATIGRSATATTGISITVGSSNATAFTNVQPTVVAGITMIRSA